MAVIDVANNKNEMAMNCVECGHEMGAGVKFCPECGAKQELKCGACGAALGSGVKFCPECGAKTGAVVGAGGTAAGVVSRIDLVPSPLGLPDCPVTFQEVSAEGPNEDNELRITVKYQITNDTEKDWEYFEVQTKLLSASGQIVEESNDTQEQAVSAGESADFESSFWGIKQAALGGNPEQAHIVVTATACGFAQQELGEVDIPETAYDPVALKPAKVGDVVQLVGGSLWKTPVDDDKECHVEVKALVQNLTSHYLPQVKVIAEVTDKSGREVTDAGGSGEIRPGALSAINGSGWEKEKKFKGAKAALSIRAYWPVATGMSQQQGMVITAGERNEDEPEGHVGNWPFTTGRPDDEGSESEENRVTGRLIDARIGVVRRDWDAEQFGDEISFWSRDNPQIFEIDEEPVEDYAREALLVTVFFHENEVSVAATKSESATSFMKFVVPDPDEDQEFGGAWLFIAEIINSIVKNGELAGEAAWLILNNGTNAVTENNWQSELDSDCDWNGEVGGGDQLHVSEAKYAGGLFLDVVSYSNISVDLSEDGIDYGSDEADDKRDESSRFVGVGVAKIEEVAAITAADLENDPMYDQAVDVVLTNRRVSISLVQRNLGIGYDRAARLIEAMASAGLVSDADATGHREILTRTADTAVMPTDQGRVPSELARFVEQARQQIKNDKFLFSPIPEKKLSNAIGSYAPNVDKRDVVLLVDSTVFGSAKEGLLLTTRGLYAKDLGQAPQGMSLSEIARVEYKSALLTPQILVNGMAFFQAGGLDKKDTQVLVELLQKLCNELRVGGDVPLALADEFIDCIVSIEATDQVNAQLFWTAKEQVLGSLGTRVRWIGKDESSGQWRQLNNSKQGDYRHFRAALQVADRRGPINPAVLSMYCDGVKQLAQRFNATVGMPVQADVLAKAKKLDEVCAPVDVQFWIYVVSRVGAGFEGVRVSEAAEAAGLQFAEDGFFHARNDSGAMLFTLCKLDGTPFSVGELTTATMQGVTLQLDVPNVIDGAKAFDQMRQTMQKLVTLLDGVLIDAQRNPLSDEMVVSIRAKTAELQQQMASHNIIAGSLRAQRLFS